MNNLNDTDEWYPLGIPGGIYDPNDQVGRDGLTAAERAWIVKDFETRYSPVERKEETKE